MGARAAVSHDAGRGQLRGGHVRLTVAAVTSKVTSCPMRARAATAAAKTRTLMSEMMQFSILRGVMGMWE